MNIGQKLTVIAAALIVTLTSPAIFAQGDANAWKYSLAPYLWAVGFDGDITVKGVSQPGKKSIKVIKADIFTKADVLFVWGIPSRVRLSFPNMIWLRPLGESIKRMRYR